MENLPYDKWAENLSKIAELSQLIAAEYNRLLAAEGKDAPLLEDYGSVWRDLWIKTLQKPEEWLKHSGQFWQDYAGVMQQAWNRMLGGGSGGEPAPGGRDRRFADEAWKNDPVFAGVKQAYLLACNNTQEWVRELCGDDPKLRRRYEFYVNQYLDAVSPSNFLATNPAVMREFVETQGESLVRGMENLLHDLRSSGHYFHLSLTPDKAFTPGTDIAATPGDVVYRNYLMEIIHYRPVREKIGAVPVLAIPAWINKYYIFDLSPDKSFIRWMLEQGMNVYVVSWANPDEKLAHVTFDDYLQDGALRALEAVLRHAGSDRAALMGYCLGGTLLACLLSYLKSKGREKEVASAAFLTTLLDFTETGDLSLFIDKDRLAAVAEQMQKNGGVMAGKAMANIFSLIRANDLIWNAVVNNYLLGKSPPAFDVMYWNADVTNLPAAMHLFYLKNMYIENNLTRPGGLSLCGVPIDLRNISVPCYFLAAKEDHIAPWRGVFEGCKALAAPLTFVLAGSGHVAGVINPPDKKKYGYAVGALPPSAFPSPEKWAAEAREHAGSWWEHWGEWQKQFLGAQEEAGKLLAKQAEAICAAPGTYVLEKA